jgi:hypothetical protein
LEEALRGTDGYKDRMEMEMAILEEKKIDGDVGGKAEDREERNEKGSDSEERRKL